MPERAGNHAAVLIVLDVDGTVSPIHPPEHLASRYQMHKSLPVDHQMIEALDMLTRQSAATVAWLTSWADNHVGWLVTELGGRLAGPYIPHTPDWATRAAGWRARSLLQYLAHVKVDALIWADDAAGDDVNRRRLDRAGYRHRHLLFQPDPNIGLTVEDIEQMREFIDRLEEPSSPR